MVTSAPPAARAALRVSVIGLVQGVGFRPFVHRLALRHGLAGSVRNAAGSVQILIEGDAAELDAFCVALRSEAPPLARIDAVVRELGEPQGLDRFRILASADAPDGRLPVSPDVGICAACVRELFDPANPRYRYPFITCTDCGPRYTVIAAMPYDRERTSMAAFSQCPRCLAEYASPGDRRHHSETNSCERCGPRLRFGGSPWTRDYETPLGQALAVLARGGVLALRGLGGFHLVVDATSPAAVARLRERKGREAKPLAIMVRTLEDAVELAELSQTEARLLQGPERPIVLLRPRSDAGLAAAVAPGLDRAGVMLAYTPLHHLLCADFGRPLVMTSGNLTDEPIATGNEEALLRLLRVADGFLLHDREILARYDDSVTRVVREQPVLLRRARGYAPMPLALPIPAPASRPLLAVGPHLKNTFTLVDGSTAFVSQHIGDLESLESLEHFRTTLAVYRRLFRIEPRIAVRDLHPEYLSTQIAAELGCDRVLAVQHHHAHIAAVMAEHGVSEPVIGVALDGTGYGSDGTTWGAEVLRADLLGFERVAHLLPVALPGGDKAARSPWRCALAYLAEAPEFEPEFALAFQTVRPTELAVARRQITQRLNAPLASSMGRLFDAAAAVLGVRRESSYEGQAAMELEALATSGPTAELPYRIEHAGSCAVLDPLPLLAELGFRRQRGEAVSCLAAAFHASVATAYAALVGNLARQSGLRSVALGGGVFQNALLLALLTERLAAAGLRVLTARQLPPNDGAISYGQAAVAAAILAAEGSR